MVERYAKLDMYNVESVTHIEDDIFLISIRIENSTDIDIADLSSEITASDGYLYFDGMYFKMIRMRVMEALVIYAKQIRRTVA